MNLKFQLLLRILLVSTLSAATVTGYILWTAQHDATNTAAVTAERLARQLSLQLLRISTGTDLPERFPDAGLFEPVRNMGVCARYTDNSGQTLTATCIGVDPSIVWPQWFGLVYRRLFDVSEEITRSVMLNGQQHGKVTVTQDAEQAIALAWRALCESLTLTAVTLAVVSLMTYFSLTRLLRPAARVVARLEQLRGGAMNVRLPYFNIREFDAISTTINRLATDLQESHAVRTALNHKLLTAEEQERRWLSRELHDEVGQCLAGISALSASIRYTAERECPRLVAEADHIGHTVEHMMQLVQNVLGRLRPPELDQLGLLECTRRLVLDWNHRSAGRTTYTLDVSGSLTDLPPTLTGHVYRIVQEGLTNAAKHALAAQVWISLSRLPATARNADNGDLEIRIVDDGCAIIVPGADCTGLGLQGIRERVMALGGQFSLDIREPSGLNLRVRLPVTSPFAATLPWPP